MDDMEVVRFFCDTIKIRDKKLVRVSFDVNKKKVEIDVLDAYFSLSPEDWEVINRQINDSVSKFYGYVENY